MKLFLRENIPEHTKALTDFIRFKRWDLARGLRFEGRQLATLLVRLTPPATRQQGRQAVARDIRRAVFPLRPQDFKEPKIKALIRARDYSGLQIVFDRFKTGEFRNAEVMAFTPQLHQSARDRRGRVRRSQRKVSPDAKEIIDYIRKIQGHVGRGKGGWAAGLIHLGGRPSGWIAEHSATGDVIDRADSVVTAYIELINRSEWASRGDDDRVVANALKTRAASIKTAIRKAIEESAARSRLRYR